MQKSSGDALKWIFIKFIRFFTCSSLHIFLWNEIEVRWSHWEDIECKYDSISMALKFFFAIFVFHPEHHDDGLIK